MQKVIKTLALLALLAMPALSTADASKLDPAAPDFRTRVQADAGVVLDAKSRANSIRTIGEKLTRHLSTNRTISPLEIPPTCKGGAERDCLNHGITKLTAQAMLKEIDALVALIPQLQQVAASELIAEHQPFSDREIVLSANQKLQQIDDNEVLQEILIKRGYYK